MIEMADLLQFCVDEDASDLHIEVGAAPSIRLHGEITQLDLPPLTPEDTERLVKSIAQKYDNMGADMDDLIQVSFHPWQKLLFLLFF